jgi:hypothetical protein
MKLIKNVTSMPSYQGFQASDLFQIWLEVSWST